MICIQNSIVKSTVQLSDLIWILIFPKNIWQRKYVLHFSTCGKWLVKKTVFWWDDKWFTKREKIILLFFRYGPFTLIFWTKKNFLRISSLSSFNSFLDIYLLIVLVIITIFELNNVFSLFCLARWFSFSPSCRSLERPIILLC